MEYEKPDSELKYQLVVKLKYNGDIEDWFEIQVWLWRVHNSYVAYDKVKGKNTFVGRAINVKTKTIFAVPSKEFDSPDACIIGVIQKAVKSISENKI